MFYRVFIGDILLAEVISYSLAVELASKYSGAWIKKVG